MDKHRGKTLRVVNKDALAKVAEWVINNRGGSWRKIGKGLDISRSTLRRLKNAERDTIGEDTYNRLVSLVYEFKRAAGRKRRFDPVWNRMLDLLRSAVLPGLGNELQSAYYAWKEERASRLLLRRGTRFEATRREIAAVTDNDIWGEPERSVLLGDLTGLAARRQQEYKKLLAHACATGCDPMLMRFVRWAEKEKHHILRIELSVFCVFEPLLESPESGFVEVQWQELSADELRRFVRAGLLREKVLLTRKPDWQRLQEVVLNGPRSLYSR